MSGPKVATIAGAIAWYLNCPVCKGDEVSRESGNHMHGLYDGLEFLHCDSCGAKLRHPEVPKRIPVYQWLGKGEEDD